MVAAKIHLNTLSYNWSVGKHTKGKRIILIDKIPNPVTVWNLVVIKPKWNMDKIWEMRGPMSRQSAA